jgi:hypothetical protein
MAVRRSAALAAACMALMLAACAFPVRMEGRIDLGAEVIGCATDAEVALPEVIEDMRKGEMGPDEAVAETREIARDLAGNLAREEVDARTPWIGMGRFGLQTTEMWPWPVEGETSEILLGLVRVEGVGPGAWRLWTPAAEEDDLEALATAGIEEVEWRIQVCGPGDMSAHNGRRMPGGCWAFTLDVLAGESMEGVWRTSINR